MHLKAMVNALTVTLRVPLTVFKLSFIGCIFRGLVSLLASAGEFALQWQL